MHLPLSARALCATGAVAGALLVPAAANAATLNLDASGHYTYTAGSGFKNNIFAFGQAGPGGNISIQDQAADAIALTGSAAGACSHPNASDLSDVTCTTGPTSFVANLGSDNLADTFIGSLQTSSAMTVNGGPGNDALAAMGTVNGDDGDDLLGGTAPNSVSNFPSTMNGGVGNDTLLDGDQDTTMNGDTGVDTAKFFSGNNTITIDGVKNDGPSGGDNVGLTVENVTGGPGNDNITGRTSGANAANKLAGGGGDDVLNGLDGSDKLDGGPGADTFNGGTGTDTVDYSNRAAAVQALIGNGIADDGEAGEGDNIKPDVENVIGGFGNDVLVGQSSTVANGLSGGPGTDSLEGGLGNDSLTGGPSGDEIDGQAGNDTLNGLAGNDTIDGGADQDTINGGGGFDLLDGGSGTDTVSGNDGADQLFIRDGAADTANCGDGTDKVVRDSAGDTVNLDCEISATTFAAVNQAAEAVLK
jgi:Ca2+-binding RTX toxin-like protein